MVHTFLKQIMKQVLLTIAVMIITTAISLADDDRYKAVRFRELVIMDPKVFYHEKILDKLPRNARVVFLNGDAGGLDAVTRILAREKDIRILRVFSHGAPGQIFLNGEVIDRKALAARRADILGWAEALDEDADILLYGCDVAQKEEGEAFINELALLTGADVAASDNRTGGAENDWKLEYSTGQVEANKLEINGYPEYLDTYTVTSNANSGLGSLRQAIIEAEDGDEIVFQLTTGNETITLESELPIQESLTINGDNTAGSGTDVTISGNDPYRVLNIDAPGKTVELSNLTITGGYIRDNDNGGGIYIYGVASCTIIGCTISGNHADGWGGGICAMYSDVTIHNATIANNTAGGCGGICNYGTMTIEASTISGNTGNEYGGGIYNVNFGTLTLKNATVANNFCPATGGGIMNYGTLELINTTISGNSASDAAGLYSGYHDSSAAVTARNTIIAGNTENSSKYDYYHGPGTLTDGGYNVVEYANVAANAGGFNNATTILYNTKYDNAGTGFTSWTQGGTVLGNQNLSLSASLANNGGPTQTVALGVGSFAIDQIAQAANQCGSCSDPQPEYCPYAVDQRAITRPYNSSCDIGAYERTSQTLVELTSFTAEGFQDRVVVRWETASEIDNAGFFLWRRTGSQGEYTSITDLMIPAEGGPTWGAAYAHEDADVAPGKSYFYRLEDIDTSGTSTFHGPVSAWAGVVNIAVNGSVGPATVPASQAVSVKVSVRPEAGAAAPQEWWLCCESPLGWFSYVYGKGWVAGIQPTWVSPQIPIENLEVLNGPLPKGDYTFHFALDSRVDGRPPVPLLTQQLEPLDRLLVWNDGNALNAGFQQLPRWRTAVPKWLDSVKLRVE